MRAYTRDLERLILWSVVVRKKALSSLTVEDCEAYKDSLNAPLASFTGPKRPRTSGRWRPFAPEGLSADSQAYAVRVLRAAFAWLVEVRYLAGNPWSAVHEPATVTRELSVQVHRALPASLWTRVREALDVRCDGISGDNVESDDESRQWRAARAATILMGDSGLRRAEAALARREDLRLAEVAGDGRASRSPSPRSPSPPTSSRSVESAGSVESGRGPSSVWTLTVIGKRRKQRTVPVSGATVAALRAHWQDRAHDFDAPHANGPLIAPLWIPATRTARERHDAQTDEGPYSVDAFGRLVRMAVQRLARKSAALADFSTDDVVQLANTSAHAFRHTFGTRAVARDMPTDVEQAILGHASLQTTSIYVRAERRRVLEAAARYYDEDAE
ncbi:tyrosine-type recombinase/integrase [Caballeronia sp. RCC_10]|uniref:tyrosine-type recombinase/integrase n=1 Tax=Caballeronia sp. RCC_10 TaxID=3239227 RepID=UPI003525F381